MGTRVGKLTTQGDLLIAGAVNERLPSVVTGLVAHYPMDGTIRMVNTNLLTSSDLIKFYGNNAQSGTSTLLSDSTGSYYEAVPDAGRLVSIYYFITSFSRNMIIGDLYSYSFDARSDVDTTLTVTFRNGDNTSEIAPKVTVQLTAGVWKRVTVSNIKIDASSVARVLPVFDLFIADAKLDYRNHKMESGGNMSTVWCPSIKEPDTSVTSINCNLTYNGIHVEEGTTNLLTNPSLDNNGASWTIGNYLLRTPYSFVKEKGINKIKYVSNSDSDTSYGIEQVVGSISANTVYTYSVYVESAKGHIDAIINNRTSGQMLIQIQFMDSSSTVLSTAKITSWDRISDNLIRFITTATSPANTVKASIQCKIDTPNLPFGVTTKIYYPQLERKDYPTSFTVGTRPDSKLTLPFPYKPPFTVSLKHKSSKYASSITNQLTSPFIFSIGDSYYKNASIVLWNYGKSLMVYAKGNTSSDWTAILSGVKTLTSDIWDNVENTYTLSVGSDKRTIKLYMNGVFLGSIVSTEDLDNIYGSKLSFTSSTADEPNARFKDISIYNTELSADQVNKLANSRFDIDENGFVKNTIIEKPSGPIPNDAYYFPLCLNSKDRFASVGASIDTNIVYSRKGAWVGGLTNNLLNFNSYVIYSAGAGTGTMTIDNKLNEITINVNAPAAVDRYGINQKITSPPTGATAYAQYYEIMVLSTDSNAVLYGGYNDCAKASSGDYGKGVTSALASSYPLNKWIPFSTTWAPSGDYTSMMNYFWVQGGTATVKIRRMQMEQTPFSSPYTLSSRGYGSLSFNLNATIGLDWSKDWSIVYWKKPVGTNTQLLTGYNIDSLGSGDNTVGAGYLWWGKDASSDTISGATPTAIDPTKYFNTWRMISIQKTGSTITIKEWSPKEGVYTRTATVSIATSNYFVTQYGYDLKLGGFNNGAPMNSYYRDLIVARRLLTDAELYTMANTFMKARPSGLQIQGGISENNIL